MLSSAISYVSSKEKKRNEGQGGGRGGSIGGKSLKRSGVRQKLNGNKKAEALAGVSAGVDVPRGAACQAVMAGQMDGCREVLLSSLHLLHSAALLQ